MGKLRDLTGQRFGRLTVIERAEDYRPRDDPTKRFVQWRCLCNPKYGGCGAECIVLAQNLRQGGTRSCGCLRREESKKRLHPIKKQGGSL